MHNYYIYDAGCRYEVYRTSNLLNPVVSFTELSCAQQWVYDNEKRIQDNNRKVHENRMDILETIIFSIMFFVLLILACLA